MGEQTPSTEKTYYLAGPMTGIENYNFPAFDRACELLREGRKLSIKSPHEIDHGETEETRGSLHYSVYMRAALQLLLECDGIILLPYWENSSGAQLEYRVARALDMPIFQIMTLDFKWWVDDKYSPLLFLEKRATHIPGDMINSQPV